MNLDYNVKDTINIITIHVSLMMYGDVFLRIDNMGGTIQVSWCAVADGGSIFDDGNKEIQRNVFPEIVDSLYAIEYPDEEDLSMTLCWEIQFGNRDEQVVTCIDAGYWGNDVISDVVEMISEALNNDESVSYLKEIVDF